MKRPNASQFLEFRADPTVAYNLVVQDDGHRETQVEVEINGVVLVARRDLLGTLPDEVALSVQLASLNRMRIRVLGLAGAKVTLWIDGSTTVPPPIITTAFGTGIAGWSGDGGPASQAQFTGPSTLAQGPDGSTYIGDGPRVRRVAPNGVISTIAGTGVIGCTGDGGPATQAQLTFPHADAVGADGSVYIADFGCLILWRIAPDGIIHLIAGGLGAGYSGDGGPANLAKVGPGSVAVAPDGTLYLTDNHNNRIRKIDTGGIITLVAGNGVAGSGGDGGPAVNASLNFPQHVALAPDGSLYISDNRNAKVRKISPGGIISTFAGNGTPGYSGDGGPATSAQLGEPAFVSIGPDGSVYISDLKQHVVRRVTTNGIINTWAGTGVPGYNGDNILAVQAQLNQPYGIVFAPDGALLIAELSNHRVRRVK